MWKLDIMTMELMHIVFYSIHVTTCTVTINDHNQCFFFFNFYLQAGFARKHNYHTSDIIQTMYVKINDDGTTVHSILLNF